MFELNPIDILGKRECTIMYSHFSKIKLDDDDFMKIADSNWIKNRLKGRYCITTLPTIDSNNKLKLTWFVGFENSKELTYFMLACPFLRRN